MKLIPCKPCPNCGSYHTVTDTACQCGADLTDVAGRLVPQSQLGDQLSRIDLSQQIYVQKCSSCGKENFPTDPNKRVCRCYHCTKPRIMSVVPVPYEPVQEAPKAPAQPQPEPRHIAPVVTQEPEAPQHGGFYGQIFQNLQDLAGQAGEAPKAPAAPVTPPAPKAPDQTPPPADTGKAPSWADILGVSAAPQPEVPQPKPAPAVPAAPAVSRLTLSSSQFGGYTFSLSSDSPQLPYLMGRTAGCQEFLGQDGYVSSSHCYLLYRDNHWVVRDNHSTNGTGINGETLPSDGEKILRSGDRLILGHNVNSTAFQVTID